MRLLDRVLRFVLRELTADRLCKIDVGGEGEVHDLDEYVGQLGLDCVPTAREQLGLVLRPLPQQDLLEFGRLDGDGGGEILQRVELRPVPLVPESTELILKFRQRRSATGGSSCCRHGTAIISAPEPY